jgi:hypothetical protein
LLGRTSVVNSGLLDSDGADAGEDGPLGQRAVADDLSMPEFVSVVRAALQVGGDFGLDGLGQELLGALAENIGKHVLGGAQWQGRGVRGSVVHGGVLQCLVGMWVVS